VSDGDRRSFGPSSFGHATILLSQITLLLVRGSMSGLNEEASYKGDCLDAFSKTNRLPALSGLPGQTPAKAGQVPRRRELLHGDPDFGSDPNGCTLTDAWNATEQDHRFCPTQNGW